MLVRHAEARDFHAIATLTNHYIEHSVIHFGTEAVTASELEGAWGKGRAVYPWLVAEVGGVLAGYAKAGVWRDRAAYQWTPEVGIYVEPAMQGRGVGRALYRALIDSLRAQGFHSVVAGITLPNLPSVRLHESCGFTHLGTVRHAGFKFGHWHDVGFWQLPLHDAAPGHAPGAIVPPPPPGTPAHDPRAGARA